MGIWDFGNKWVLFGALGWKGMMGGGFCVEGWRDMFVEEDGDGVIWCWGWGCWRV